MDFELGDAAAALRARLRALIADEIPTGFLGAFTDDPADLAITQRFCHLLADQDLLTLAWPTEFGGAGGSVWDQTVVREEMWAHHEPRGPQYMGLNWVGPAIMAFGTPDQKARHLPPIASGDVIWCQGFSEPDAGSDLAALSTRATPVADVAGGGAAGAGGAVGDGRGGYRISGQKIWTSYAGMAQWCVLAARVGPGERHEGITMFVVPMDSPGITVVPIASMLGPHHLNEVFFDDVAVGADAVLGEVGGGWAVIRRALAHERVGIARYARCERLLSLLGSELRSAGVELPEHLAAAWARALTAVRVARLLAYRVVLGQESGGPPDAAASAARVAVTRCDQLVAELLFQVLGEAALEAGPTAPLAGAIEDHWRYAQAATVASGTLEVQQMIVAKDLLGRSA